MFSQREMGTSPLTERKISEFNANCASSASVMVHFTAAPRCAEAASMERLSDRSG